ncbi:MAG TPA: four helix bundle protein [Nitrospirae bacterium]|nr:four helix bundle protein [Nitrospirota bacterium]HDZ02842.1 four helix bundle protein [Nitrospirota bacterium]
MKKEKDRQRRLTSQLRRAVVSITANISIRGIFQSNSGFRLLTPFF